MKQRLILMFLFALATAVQADDDVYLAGKEGFEIRCADTCHQPPEAGQLNPKQWRIVLTTMQKRMHKAGMERMTEQEFEQILHYLTVER